MLSFGSPSVGEQDIPEPQTVIGWAGRGPNLCTKNICEEQCCSCTGPCPEHTRGALASMKAKVITAGNIFRSNQQAVVCPVNTRGMMGALAAEFQTRWPAECQTYVERCTTAKGSFTVGDIHIAPILTQTSSVQGVRGAGPKWVIFFPTMIDPGSNSSTLIVLMGLQNMIPVLKQLGITSIALPALGCGVGGLKFETVLEIVNRVLGPIPDLSVDVYAPLP